MVTLSGEMPGRRAQSLDSEDILSKVPSAARLLAAESALTVPVLTVPMTVLIRFLVKKWLSLVRRIFCVLILKGVSELNGIVRIIVRSVCKQF